MSSTIPASPITAKGDTGASPLPNPTKETPTLSALTKPTETEDIMGGKGKDSQLITAFPLPSLPASSSSSASYSLSISPSSSITTDTSVAAETNCVLASDKNTHEKYKVEERATELNDDTTMPATNPSADADPKSIDTTTVTIASTPASAPSTPASSSSTSIPLPTPFNSLTSTSTSPSTTNVDDMGIDANGLTSLLRPRPQINPNLNVKFAPLPELAPRKRKSSTPLGMAARSQLARRRRMMYRDSYDDDEMYEETYRPRRFNPPETSEKEEMEAIDGLQESGTKKKKSKKTKEGETERKEGEKEGEQSEDEDPLAALAKKMGRAGKHIWRKMSTVGKVDKNNAGDKNLKTEPVLVLEKATSEPDEEQQGVEKGQGSVWVEKVEELASITQETRGKGSVEIEPTLHEATAIPPLPSEPQTRISPATLRPSSQETLETGVTRERDSKLDGRLNDPPTSPTIVVSAA